jgi:RNA polymerase sigma-70 factor
MTDSGPIDERYETFLRCFAQERDRVFAYVQSLLPHRADAEDVFQRCSIVLWRKFEDFDPDREFLPWACGVAFYEVRNFLRVAARDRLQFDEDLIAQLAERRLDSLRNADHRLNALRGCLGDLKPHDRELVSAAYDDERPLSEFARSTGRALQTLYNRLSVVRRRLLDCVQRKLAIEGEST